MFKRTKQLKRIADCLEEHNRAFEEHNHNLQWTNAILDNWCSVSQRNLRESEAKRKAFEHSILTRGLSSICRNLYVQAIEERELKELIKELFGPERNEGNA